MGLSIRFRVSDVARPTQEPPFSAAVSSSKALDSPKPHILQLILILYPIPFNHFYLSNLPLRMTVVLENDIEVGETLPPMTEHVRSNQLSSRYTSLTYFQAVSVSLPSWKANVGYEEGEEWVVSKMKTGYPR